MSGGDDGSTAPDETVLTLVFAADAGQQMLESSPSVSEVIRRLRAFVAAVGLPECEVDATMSALTLSYWKPGLSAPVTVMRAVEVSNPRLGRLSGTLELLDRVEQRSLTASEAMTRLGRLRSEVGRGDRFRVLAVLASVTGWVFFFNGSATTILVALLASLVATPGLQVAQRMGLPAVFGTTLSVVVLAAVPNLAAAAGVPVSVGPAVVGAMFVYLPGVTVVSAVIDALNNAPLSAVARGLLAVVTAGALALGMLAGSSLGAGLGLKANPDATSVPLVVSVTGAALGMAGLALAYGIPRRALLPTLLMGSAGWLALALLTDRGAASGWPAYLLAATTVGVIGEAAAARQATATSVYLGVAILPLVPGFVLYQAMLGLALGEPGASDTLGRAGLLSMAIAVGVALGVALGSNLVWGRRVLVRHLPARQPRRP